MRQSLGYHSDKLGRIEEIIIETQDDVPLIDPNENEMHTFEIEQRNGRRSLPLFDDLDQLYQDVYNYYKDHGLLCKSANIAFSILCVCV
ncbi:hypothetical protein ACOME3_010443 [Neoechinorhynchus agilis]